MGSEGFEPSTPRASAVRAPGLRYEPTFLICPLRNLKLFKSKNL